MGESIADFIETEAFNGTESKMTGLSGAEVVGATITGDSLIDLQDSVINAYQKNCRWIMNRKTKNVVRKLKDGQGNYLLERDYASGNGGWTLLGKPVELTDKLEEGDVFYGDYSGLAFKIAENPSIETLREKYAEQHAIGLCAWLEMDCNILVPQKIKRIKAAKTSE
jgi:HK97 family phage major capsid protein